jgi:hypothetical protein
MRPILFALALVVVPGIVMAQSLREIGEAEPMPDGMLASLALDLEEDLIIDGVQRWEGDLAGDATPDQLVEVTVAYRGGNAYFFTHWIFIGEGNGFPKMFPIDLGGGLQSVSIDGNDLVAVSYAYRDGDARCCPSGTEVTRIPLR